MVLCGGCAANDSLAFLCQHEASKYNLELVRASKSLCGDNAAMIAWMGWELKYAEQDVDMRQYNIEALESLPIGSFCDKATTMNHKERAQYKAETNNDAPSLFSQARQENAYFN